MKKKFILLAMMLLTLIGGVNLNVLNAQEQYRIKSVSTGKYLHIFNHDQHSGGQFGGVGVSDYEESVNQIFTFEPNGTGYRVKSADGYYIYCQQWNVDAYNTSSYFSTTLTGFDFNGESFRIGRMYSSSEYFKVEYVSAGGNTYVFCNCTGNGDGTIETWKLEPVIVDDGVIPAAPTNLVATAIDHKSISLTWTAGDENALKYNIYQGGENIGSTTETSYTVNGLTAETNYCFTVEAVRGVNVSESHSDEACATTSKAPAIQDIVVGNGSGTINYLPTYTYYGNTISQQIYTAADLALYNSGNSISGKINKIAFNVSNYKSANRKVDVYMINTTKTGFSATTDWISMTDDDLVYSGEVHFANGWVEISLDNDFIYEGDNILLCVNDKTNSYTSYGAEPYFYTWTPNGDNASEYRTLVGYKDDVNYDAHNFSGVTATTRQYFVNQIIFTVEVSTDPSIEVNPASLDFGTVRAGGDFWTEKEIPSFDVNVTAKNTTIESVSIDDNFFTSDKDLATAAGQAEFNFTVSYNKAAEADEKSGNIVVTYMNGEEEATVEIPMTATAYEPVQGDVVENPIEVTFDENGVYTYTINSLDGFYDDYVFSPNEQYDADAPDMVFSFTLTEDALVTLPLNYGWASIYGDFTIDNGPQYIVNDPTGSILLAAGTYYVANAPNIWDLPFEFSITKSSVPAPEISYSSPMDESANNVNPELTWNMKYAETYKVMLGTSEDALEEVAAETAIEGQTEYSFQTSELQNNTKYYWQVIATNETGTTTGEVRSFVTLLDVPQITSPTTVNLYPGETTTITWEAVANATSYKVYNGETVLATLEATETSYELSGLEYNMTGYNITVTATQEGLGESLKSTAVVVKVAGTFPLTVNVKDSNNTPIEGATVTVDMAKAYDEFGVQVADMEAVTTDAEGKVTITFPLLGAYGQYGSSSFTPYYTLVVSKSPYTATSTTVSTAYGIPTSRDFTLYLPTPSNLYPENDEYMLLAGGNLTLNWTAVEGVTGYNVYRQGAYNNSTWTYEYELLGTSTVNTYTAVAEYDGEGSYYAVSAVFEGGIESDKTSTYNRIYVLGTGEVEGLVTDTEGNPVAGAALKLSGTTGFGEDIHILETEADGTFLVEDVIEGTYSLTVSHYNYEVATVSGILVNYNIEYDLGTIVLTPKASIENVTVTADNNGNVSWTGDYAKWNVYRRNVEEPQELTSVATEVTTTSAADAAWETLEPGTYQYGVAGFVTSEGFGIVVEEDFESYNVGDQLAGWIVPGPYSSVSSHYFNSGSKSFYTYYYNNGNYYFIMPYPINPEGANMSFYYKCYPYYGTVDKLKVCYSTTLSEDATWTNFDFVGASATWEQVNIDLSSITEETIYIAFLMESVYANGIFIDDIVITGMATTSVETQIVWSDAVVKQGPNTFIGGDTENPTAWNVDANWSHGNAPEAGDEVIVNAEAVISGNVELSALDIVGNGSVTVDANASLTVTGAITQEQNYSLIMNDGAQVFQNNANVTAQFNMNLVNPSDWSTSNKDGWQFISSPLSNVSVTNIAEGNYDLYKYDGDAESELEWLNHKDENFADATYQHHIGYLASHETMSTLEFKGTLNYNDYNGSYAFYDFVEYYENEPLKNFYLIGNPYPFNISWADFKNNKGMVNGYAYVKEDGNYGYATSGEIAVGDGFFVQAISGIPDDPYSTYYYYVKGSGNTRSTKASNNSLNITATGNAGEDNVIINLAGKSEGFDKLQNFNDAIATVYVAEDGKNYGIYNCDADVQEVELSFNANQMGNYTISIEPNGKFQTVTLVDRFTGIETNMLVEDYHFTAMSNVNTNRFIIKMVNGKQTTDNSHFVFQSGEDLIIDAEGTVQIIDVMGRVLVSDEVESTNNRINVSGFQNGTYMVRVINGSEVKVEKVVIY